MSVVNLKGRKPKCLLPNEVYIGRAVHMGGWSLPSSKWKNPYSIGTHEEEARQLVLEKYERYIHASSLIDDIEQLRGKDLACWCHPEPCHGDILLKLLN
jgi:hypothetical protein